MPLTRVLIEEIGVDEDEAASSFRKKVEMSSAAIDKPDLFHVGGSDSHRHDNGIGSLRNDSSIDVLQTCGQGDGHQNVFKPLKPSSLGSVPSATNTFSVPTSSFQFQADWKILRHQEEEFYLYFKVNFLMFMYLNRQ